MEMNQMQVNMSNLRFGCRAIDDSAEQLDPRRGSNSDNNKNSSNNYNTLYLYRSVALVQMQT